MSKKYLNTQYHLIHIDLIIALSWSILNYDFSKIYCFKLTVIEKKSSRMSQSNIFPLLTYLYVRYFWVRRRDTRWLNPPNKGIYLQKVYYWKSIKLISGLSSFTAEMDFIVPSSKQAYIFLS